MFRIDGQDITLTRGDTFKAIVTMYDMDKEEVTPVEGDVIRFALKRRVSSDEVLIYKDIPTDTMLLEIDPEDTKSLGFGTYVYDVQITSAAGEIDTFIPPSKFVIAEEVE